MGWWLFQDFEERVKCFGRQHVDFIDDEDGDDPIWR
jgi:hypothetical protein